MISVSGCTGKEKISGSDAIRIALNDSQTLSRIDNNEYRIADVGSASLSMHDGKREDMYAVTIEVQNRTAERIIVFVNFEGKVVLVDTSYTAKAPDYLLRKINESRV
ncbi:MAG: hypothetical protein WC586_11850 [Methanoregula sp.]